MGEMPIVGVAVHTGILAHRRDADAIGERNLAQAKRAEKVRHGGRSGFGEALALLCARRDRADSRILKWMLLRLIPAPLFRSMKAMLNSTRLAIKTIVRKCSLGGSNA